VPGGLPRSRWGLGAALAALLLFTGCAYFNTFYHARRFYADAEQIRETEARAATTATMATPGQNQGVSRTADLYKKSIEKCQKLIENFPGSRWEDDAYLLMAKGYYGKGDYLSARRELDRFVERFSESGLLPEAIYWRGLTAYAQQDYASAETIWSDLLETHPKFDGREDVEFYLAQTLDRRKMIDEAIQAYGDFLTRHPKGEWSVDARLQLGRLRMERRQYPEAEQVFTEVIGKAPEEDDRLQGKLYLGEALGAQGRHEEALELYQDLGLKLDPNVLVGRTTKEEREALAAEELARLAQAREDSLSEVKYAERDSTGAPIVTPATAPRTTAPPSAAALNPNRHMLPQNDVRYDQLARVMLREGTALAEVGKPMEAILTFEQVIAEYPRTAYASEAQYRIGYVYEVDMDDFDEAQKAYGKVAEQGRSSFTEDAARRARNLGAVKTLMGAATDSLSKATASAAEGRFLRAELYLFQQAKPERALEEYMGIQQDFKGTEHAAKAALAEAWVRVTALADTARGRAKYAEVMKDYADTEYGRRASRILRGPERELKPEEFTGPGIDELRDPMNLAAVAARDSLLAAREQAEQDRVRAEAVRDSLAQAEAAQLANAERGEQPGQPGTGAPGSPELGVPPGGPGSLVGGAQPGGPGTPASGRASAPRKLSPSEMATMSLPRGPSGKLLDPMAIPSDGWTPVLGMPPDSVEIARRAAGSGRRVVHTLTLPQQADSVMATPIGVVPTQTEEPELIPATPDSAGAARADTTGLPFGDAAPADTTGPSFGEAALADTTAAPADTSAARSEEEPPGD
jgi:TolA-binding protein